MRRFKKQQNKNFFKIEIMSKVKPLKKDEFWKRLKNIKHAYLEGKRLEWDVAREKTKYRIIKYLISIFEENENKELAKELNQTNDIQACMAWFDINFKES